MNLYSITADVPGLGLVQHVTTARDTDAAKARIIAAHPGAHVVRVVKLADRTEDKQDAAQA